jgi:hypothetical protein
MKNQSATISLKRFLILAFVCFSAMGFSQTNDLGIEKMKNSPEITYDFLGRDLIIQSPSGINDLNLAVNRLNPALKGAVVNQSKLDSILEMTNYGTYIDRCKWQFDYDSNNFLKTSSRLFLDVDNKFKNKKELRVYDENGQILSLICTENPSFLKDSLITTYIEENQYLNGNLMKRNTSEYFDSFSRTIATKTFTYNEKNQLSKMLEVFSSGLNENYRTTEYVFDQDGRQKYKIQVYGKGPEFSVTKNEYKVTDTTMIIQERSGTINNYKLPSSLEQIRNWQDGETYLLNFDQFGRTISIEKSYSNIKQKIKYTFFRVEYDYTSTGKLKQSTFYLPDDQFKFKSWNKATIIKNLYNADDNLQAYEKTFYDARVGEWVAEETKTYYYNLIKNAVTGNSQNKTSDFYIYPNPATDCIHFSIRPEIHSNYIIYNLLGEVVAHGDFEGQSISISQLPSGTYFIKVDKNGVGFVNRFYKK